MAPEPLKRSISMKHFKYSPSKSHRWLKCPGSESLIEALNLDIETSNQYADEGTAAHKGGEICFKSNSDPFDLVGTSIRVSKDVEITFNEEMADAVEQYIDYVYRFLCPEVGDVIFVEKQVPLFYAKKEKGTSDLIGYCFRTKTLHVFDFKYGQGVKVLAKGNSQLHIYGISSLGYFLSLYDIKNVCFHIVQPRMKNFDRECLPLNELNPIEKEIKKGYKEANKENAVLIPGEEQCRFCPVANCEARARHVFDVIGGDFENLDAKPFIMPRTLSDEDMAKILNHVDEINSFISALQSQAYKKLESGDRFPGFKLVQGNAHRRYSDENRARSLLLLKFRRESIIKESLISPSELDKLIRRNKKKLSEKYIHNLQSTVTKPEGKVILVKDDDPRQPVNASSDFEDLDDILG